jgi:hypothetical protein
MPQLLNTNRSWALLPIDEFLGILLIVGATQLTFATQAMGTSLVQLDCPGAVTCIPEAHDSGGVLRLAPADALQQARSSMARLQTFLSGKESGIDEAYMSIFFDHLKVVADSGDVDASFSLATYFFSRSQPGGASSQDCRAIEYFARAARLGHRGSQALLALAHLTGNSVNRNAEAAYAWWRLSRRIDGRALILAPIDRHLYTVFSDSPNPAGPTGSPEDPTDDPMSGGAAKTTVSASEVDLLPNIDVDGHACADHAAGWRRSGD